MRRNTRRLPALLLVILLFLGMLPVTAWAASFPSNFYASITLSSNTESFGTVSSTGVYTKTGATKNRVISGMESAGGVFFTVEGNRGKDVSLGDGEHIMDDDGWRELRMYNSTLTNYRTIGEVNQKGGGYWIVDTAMDLSGEAPALYGTYNSAVEWDGSLMAFSTICSIDLTDGHTSNYLTVTGLSSTRDIIYAIAFDNGGTLYAIGADAGDNGGPATLYTIDLDSAANSKVQAQKVAEIKTGSGYAVSTNFAQDLDFDYTSGTLYWAENKGNVVYTLNTQTAKATQVGQVKYNNKAYALQSFCFPKDTALGQNDDQYMVSVIYSGGGKVTSNNVDKAFYMVGSGDNLTLALTPDENGKLLSVKMDGQNVSVDNLTEYTFNNVTANHVIEVTFRDNLPVTQKNMTWFHYQGYEASFYTQHHAYKFYELPYTTDAPKEGYTQTLLDENGQDISNDTVIPAGNYYVRVTHPGTDEYNALNVVYENALQLAKCPGTPGRPVVYGKVGCTQGDLVTTSALQDYYGTDGNLIDAAHDEIPVTLVWLDPETRFDTAGNFYANATIYAAQGLEQRLKDCYTLDDGTSLIDGCLISYRRTQVVVLPADEASLIKLQTSDASGGTVSGKGVYKNGDKVTVTATVNANAGYQFKGWQNESGQTVSEQETYTFTAGGDRTLTALFEISEDYRVILKTDPQDGGTVTGGGSYKDEPEHKATVTATAKQGYYFIGWYAGEDQKSTSANYTFEVPEGGIALTAKFGMDYLARAEQAKTNFASAVSTDAFEWQTLVQAVEAYEAAADFVENPPSVIENASNRYAELTNYYSGIEELDLSGQGISSVDLAKLYLFTGVTDLNLSGNTGITSLTKLPSMALETLNLSSTGIIDLTNLPEQTGLRDLNLSNTGVTDLTGLGSLSALETLNLSNNKGVTDLSALKGLNTLKALDISGTGVTELDSLVTESKPSFPGYQNLTAQKLTLNSISALAQLVSEDGFEADNVSKWDFTGSTLPATEDNKTDVATIQGKLSDKQFLPPTIQTTPAPVPTPTEYGVVVADCAHGRLSTEPAKAAEGATVIVTATPDEGYEALSVAVTAADGATVEVSRAEGGTWTFVMPACDVTVTATFGCDGGAACPSHGLSDVDQSQWYHDAVDWAVSSGVMTGYEGTGLFGPDDELSRAQMAQILWNVEGRPVVDHPVDFGDVREGDWHYQAVAWAASEGVFGGYADGSGLFGADDALTREQAAAVLMRWAEARGDDVSARADLAPYPDSGDVSDWAAESMSWAVAADVLRGAEREDGTLLLDPAGTANRAQTATLMMRLIG